MAQARDPHDQEYDESPPGAQPAPRPPTGPPDPPGDRTLLDHFPQHQRSTISNLFLAQIRSGYPPPGHAHAGAWTARGVRDAVLLALGARLQRAFRHGRGGDYARDAAILRVLHDQGGAALAFAAWALARAALPREERERRKQGRAREHIAAWMDHQPPTDKQVAYLRRMGYAGPIDSTAHASALIDIYTRGYAVVRGVA